MGSDELSCPKGKARLGLSMLQTSPLRLAKALAFRPSLAKDFYMYCCVTDKKTVTNIQTIKLITSRTLFCAFMMGLMVSAASLKAQNLIAHFPLDSDGDSSDGNFTASIVTDV